MDASHPSRGIAVNNQLKNSIQSRSGRFPHRLRVQPLTQKHLKQQVKELQASEARLRSIINNNADGILIVDAEGLVQFANPAAAALFRCRVEELDQQSLFGGLILESPTIDTDLETDVIRAVGETATSDIRVVQSQVDVLRRDGKVTAAEMRIVETEWEGKIAYVASFRDITERKRAAQALWQSEVQLRQQAQALEQTLIELKQTQSQLVHSEKMSSLGQMVAGLAHEVNNPVNFIHGNLTYVHQYMHDLLNLLRLYQQHYPVPAAEIQAELAAVDLDFLLGDLPKILSSMQLGTERLRQIILSLRNFSRLDESEMKPVDIHEGINNTLLLLQHRLKGCSRYVPIQVIKEYGQLPQINCYAGQLNQVFMNILANAIDALEGCRTKNAEVSSPPEDTERATFHLAPTIRIQTSILESDRVLIQIADNGCGIDEAVRQRLFDPFFTTKPVGQGTGLGLSISDQIVRKHGGLLQCQSEVGQGTVFRIELPIPKVKQ